MEDVNSVVSALRTVLSAVQATAAQMPLRRAIGIATAIVILVAVAIWVPLPNAVEMRDWAAAAGPWFPLAFLVAHTVVTVLPFPVPHSPSPQACCSVPPSASHSPSSPAR